MKWYLEVLRNYAGFSGRARRKEYWMFTLFHILFCIVAMLLDNLLGTAIEGVGYGFIYFAYALVVVLPSLAVIVRRLHDIGKSGWFILLSFIPIVGGIWLLVLLCREGESESNGYGPDPKEEAEPIMA